MGDRAIVVFKGNGYYSPGVYLHWVGGHVDTLLKDAAPRLRKNDPYYSAARFCGVCHETLPGNLGLGMFPPPDDTNGEPDWKEYSQSDAGVVIVDVTTGMVEFKEGYLADEGKTMPPLALPR